MKRKLTPREWILLGLLGCIVVISGYVMLFYLPMTTRRDAAISETEACRAELEAVQIQVEEKRRMERELERIFAESDDPLSLAPYDNLKQVMVELNTILTGALDYSLSFGTVDESETIVRRSISLTYRAGTYERAKAILQQIHDSAYRCMQESVNITIGEGSRGGGAVTVNTTLVYFEYQ